MNQLSKKENYKVGLKSERAMFLGIMDRIVENNKTLMKTVPRNDTKLLCLFKVTRIKAKY